MDNKPKETHISEEFFLKTKLKGENDYKNTSPVYCPYLKEKVNFNASGLEHIKFRDTHGRPRKRFDQYTRFKLFYLTPQILKDSHTVQGKWETKEWERYKKHGKWESLSIDVTYYEFVAVIGRVRLKIIVRKIAKEGSYIFWSIIPFWKMKENEGDSSTRILHDGNPAED